MECYNEQLFTDDEEWAEPFSFNFDKILIDVSKEDKKDSDYFNKLNPTKKLFKTIDLESQKKKAS